MNKKLIAMALSVLMCASFFGCTASIPEEKPQPTADPTAAVKETYLNEVGTIAPLNVYLSGSKVTMIPELSAEYIKANSAFTVKMLNALDENWTGVFSPLSIQIALELLSNGADEQTAVDLLNAVCPGMTREDVNSNADKIISMLLKANGVSFNNAVISNNNFRLSQTFARSAADYYSSAVGALDFSDPASALNEINSWIKNNTKGLIENMLDETVIGADTAIVLINALTLDLKWEQSFYALREIIEFAGSKGTESTTVMGASGKFGYGEFDSGCMVTLPYAGGEFAMAVILPDKGVSPATAVEAMMNNTLDCTISDVVIKMPSIELDSKLDILGMAGKLGLDRGLGGVYPNLVMGDSPRISSVLQQNYIFVNEGGTLAASASAVAATKGAPMFEGEHTVICDRPYAMLIYHIETGTVMFVSLVNDIG